MKLKNRADIENTLFLMSIIGLTGHIPDNDTPEMQRFSDCLDACLALGYKGCIMEEFPKGNGDSFYILEHDEKTKFGRVMLKLYLDAKNGVMPPEPSEVIEILEKNNGHN